VDEQRHSLEDVAQEFGVDLDEPDDLGDRIARELAASDVDYADRLRNEARAGMLSEWPPPLRSWPPSGPLDALPALQHRR
jgi:hypothetical protein